jgi:ferredoxin
MSNDQVTLLINRDACIGFGECVSEDPDAVSLGDDGCAHALRPTLERSRAERICAVCPTGAITVDG